MAKGVSDFHKAFNRTGSKTERDKVEKRQEERGGGWQNYWSPVNGKSVIRILPPGSAVLMGQGKMGKMVYKHFLYWNGKNQSIHICSAQTDPDDFDSCPICVALERVEDVIPEPQWKRQRAKPRSYFNVLIRRLLDPDGDPIKQELWGKVFLCEAASGLYDFVTLSAEDPEMGFFIDPHKGADLIIKRTGKDIETRYNYDLKPGEWTPVMSTIEETEELIADLTDIDKISQVPDSKKDGQVEAAQAILQWASQFGKVDTSSRGGSDADIDDLMGDSSEDKEAEKEAEKRTSSEPEKRSKEATTATATASKGGVSQPDLDSASGLPVCFKEFKKRNPTVSKPDEAIHAQCKICEFSLPCSFEG